MVERKMRGNLRSEGCKLHKLIGKWDTSFGSGRSVCGNLPKNVKQKKCELASKANRIPLSLKYSYLTGIFIVKQHIQKFVFSHFLPKTLEGKHSCGGRASVPLCLPGIYSPGSTEYREY